MPFDLGCISLRSPRTMTAPTTSPSQTLTSFPGPLPSHTRRTGRRKAGRGFTIVELLATIAIIAALMSLLLVGLQAARRASKSTKERANIKQVYMAWQQYANTYDDAAMPGFIEAEVQQLWNVKYKGSDRKTPIPAQYCETYPHRLMPYLDHSADILYDYMERGDDDFFKPNADTDGDGSVEFNDPGMLAMSRNPAFGYNAYYIGGWWRQVNGGAKLRFGNAVWQDSTGQAHQGKVVALKASGLERPSSMIVFCGSALRSTGFYKTSTELDDGAAWVVPHILAGEAMWSPWDGSGFGNMQTSGQAMASPSLFGTLAQATDFTLVQSSTGVGMQVTASGDIGVPFKRFGVQVSVVHGDGSVAGAGVGELQDQSRWMNPASQALDKVNFTHSNAD